MLEHFDILKPYVKYVRHPTESFLFYLHYRITFLALVWCCVVVTSKLMVGHPIICTPTLPAEEVVGDVMNAYCWAYGTYSIGSAYQKQPGIDIPHPGVDTSEDTSDFIHRDYYQYVYFVLFLQAVLFYVPHGLWKRLENGEFYKMMELLNSLKAALAKNSEEFETKHITKYRNSVWGCFNNYALKYHFCEILQLLNISLQIWLLNVFFKGHFVTLGLSQGNGKSYRELIDQVFPRVTKCHFKKFGANGVIDTADVLCVLPINALNEKIYYVTWFWYFGLLIFDIINLCLSLLSAFLPVVRAYRILINMRFCQFWKWHLSSNFESLVFKMTMKGNFGDWFILSCLLTTMDRFDYKTTVSLLYNSVVGENNEELSEMIEMKGGEAGVKEE